MSAATATDERADALLARLRAGELLVRVYGPGSIPRWQWQPACKCPPMVTLGHPECCHAPACMWCIYCGPEHYGCYPKPAGDYASGQTISAMLHRGLIRRHGNALVIA